MDIKTDAAVAPAAGWRALWPASAGRDLIGGFNAALLGLPYTIGLGIVAFAPLGPAFAAEGALASVLGAVCVGILVPLFGGTRAMISGPRVTMALVLAAILTEVATPGSPFAGRAAVAATFSMLVLAGIFQILFGIFRVGALIRYIPYPVVAGIITGSGVVLVLSQIRALFGIPASAGILETLAHTPRPLIGALFVAGMTVAIAWTVPRRWPRLPGIFVALFVGLALHHALAPLFGSASFGGTVGAIEGMDRALFASVGESWTALIQSVSGTENILADPAVRALAVGAISVAVLASLDNLLAIQFADSLTLERTDANRELAVHGIANTIIALAGGLTSAGSPARTAASYNTGARSRLASVANALVMLVLALIFPGTLAYLPDSVVAGILVVIGLELVDKWTVARARDLVVSGWRDHTGVAAEIGIVLIVTAIAVALGLVAALGLGTLIAAVVMIGRLSRSLVRRVYRGGHIHSRRQRDPRSMETLARQGDRIAVLELEGPIFFHSADHLESVVDRLTAGGARYVVLDMKRVTEVDVTGARAVDHLVRRAARSGVAVFFSYLPREKRRRQPEYSGTERRQHSSLRKARIAFDQFGIIRALGENHVFPDTDAALAACENRILGGGKSGLRDERERQAFAGVFRGFTGDEIRHLRRAAERKTWRKGETIFAEGDRGDAIYLLSRGYADVVIRVPGSEQSKRLDTLTPGSVFGEMAVLDEKPRAATIVAAGPAVGYRISAQAFAALKREQPQLALKILSNLCLIMSARMRAANRMITELEG
jgi:MFS superfamily sulfate permease-like transporter